MRAAIRAELGHITPLDELERIHLEETRAWIDSGADLFRVAKPATPPKHLVAYFPLTSQDAILLGWHVNAERWLPNGGHVEQDEHPRDTVCRELREELAIEAHFLFDHPLFLTVTETVGRTAGHTDVSIWYALQASDDLQPVYDRAEFSDMRWFPFTNLPQQTDPHLARFVSKLRSQAA